MARTNSSTLCALSLGLAASVLCGCSSGGTTQEVTFGPGAYDAAFDAARDELRHERFPLERVDLENGVITTAPKPTQGLLSPWDGEQTSLQDEVEDFIAEQTRRVRITFDTSAADGSGTATVEAAVYRRQIAGIRPNTRAVLLTGGAFNPDLAARGVGGVYEVPVRRDDALAKRLARDIQKRIDGAPRAEKQPAAAQDQAATP